MLVGTEPIRGELLGGERLEQLAESIARHRVGGEPATAPLLARVRDNGRVLLRCYRALAAVIHEERATMPAAEWLVDNFYIVEDVLNEVRTDLPPGFYRQLPTLARGSRFATRPAPSGSLGRTSSTPTAGLNQPHFAASSAPSSASSRCSSPSCGPCPSRSASLLLENLRRLAEEIVAGPRGAPRGGPARRHAARAGRPARRSPRLRAARGRSAGPRLRGAARPAPPRPGPGRHARPRLAEQRLADAGTLVGGARARRSTSARAPPTSPCGTSSRACA